jgi:hypothetical protein
MRLPMKNITQPLVIAPTLSNLQMLASLDPDRQFFCSKTSGRIGFDRGLLTTIMMHGVDFALPLLILLSI